MVHQHVKLADNLTVVENVIIGRGAGPWRPAGHLDERPRDLAALADRYRLPLDPAARVDT